MLIDQKAAPSFGFSARSYWSANRSSADFGVAQTPQACRAGPAPSLLPTAKWSAIGRVGRPMWSCVPAYAISPSTAAGLATGRSFCSRKRASRQASTHLLSLPRGRRESPQSQGALHDRAVLQLSVEGLIDEELMRELDETSRIDRLYADFWSHLMVRNK
jgi:hypothetical protein